MRRKTNASELNFDGLKLPINNGRGSKQGDYNCYIEPLEQIKKQIDAMLSWHNKVFVFRLDVHVYQYTSDNAVISKYIKSCRDRLKKKYQMQRIGYVWCREVESKKKQHYHLTFMLDGNKVNRVGEVDPKKRKPNKNNGLFECLEYIATLQNLTISLPDNPTYMIKRKDLQQGNYDKYKKAFYRTSYFAKERGKTIKAERANSFQTSRIRMKADSRQPKLI